MSDQRDDSLQEDEAPPPGGTPGAVPLLRGGMDRVRVLLSTRRYADAERELRRQLGANPDDAALHMLLSLSLGSQDKHVEATEEAQRAIALDPLEPGAYHALAAALLQRHRFDEALSANSEALRLDPYNADYHGLKAAALLEKRDWSGGLAAADAGLACDPEDDTCRNLRAMALRQLGRRREAQATMLDQLRKSPDNALTHANQGWGCLHGGDHAKALEHFREALRLDPDMNYAREGILEALKARNVVYRLLLKWKLWMGTLSGRAQWGVIIGLYLCYRATVSMARTMPGLRPLLVPIIALYAGFVLLTWAGDPIFDSLLRINRFGRLSLTAPRRRASNLFLAGLALLPVGGVLAYVTGDWEWLLPAGGLALVALAGTRVFVVEHGWPRWVLTAALAVEAILILLGWLPVGERDPAVDTPFREAMATLAIFGLLAIWILVNVVSGVRPKR